MLQISQKEYKVLFSHMISKAQSVSSFADSNGLSVHLTYFYLIHKKIYCIHFYTNNNRISQLFFVSKHVAFQYTVTFLKILIMVYENATAYDIARFRKT